MFASKLRRAFAPAAFVIVALTAAPSFAEEIKLPQTAAEQKRGPRSIRKRRSSIERTPPSTSKWLPSTPAQRPEMKGSPKRPDVMKMSKHCDALAKDYEKLATDADKAADYQMMRAKEMQGG